MIEWIEQLPTWLMIRGSGIIAYLLLSAGVSTGILSSMRFWKPKVKAGLYLFHSRAIHTGLLLSLVHAMLLIIDNYVPFTWSEVLIPFTAPARPVWTGLGTIALYGMVFILFTTDFKMLLSQAKWKFIHRFSYLIFLSAAVHGLMGGTDSNKAAFFLMYVVTVLLISVLTAWRVLQALQSQRQNGSSKARYAPAAGQK